MAILPPTPRLSPLDDLSDLVSSTPTVAPASAANDFSDLVTNTPSTAGAPAATAAAHDFSDLISNQPPLRAAAGGTAPHIAQAEPGDPGYRPPTQGDLLNQKQGSTAPQPVATVNAKSSPTFNPKLPTAMRDQNGDWSVSDTNNAKQSWSPDELEGLLAQQGTAPPATGMAGATLKPAAGGQPLTPAADAAAQPAAATPNAPAADITPTAAKSLLKWEPNAKQAAIDRINTGLATAQSSEPGSAGPGTNPAAGVGAVPSVNLAAAAMKGLTLGVTQANTNVVTGQQASPQPPEADPNLDWGNLEHLTGQVSYQFAKTYPTLAGMIAGAGVGEIAAPEAGPVGPVVGGTIGAGMAYYVSTIKPIVDADIQAGMDPNAAYLDAVKQASEGAAWTMVSTELLGIPSAGHTIIGFLKDMAVQGAAQSSTGAAEQITGNLQAGKDPLDGVGQAALNSMFGTVVPLAAMRLLFHPPAPPPQAGTVSPEVQAWLDAAKKAGANAASADIQTKQRTIFSTILKNEGWSDADASGLLDKVFGTSAPAGQGAPLAALPPPSGSVGPTADTAAPEPPPGQPGKPPAAPAQHSEQGLPDQSRPERPSAASPAAAGAVGNLTTDTPAAPAAKPTGAPAARSGPVPEASQSPGQVAPAAAARETAVSPATPGNTPPISRTPPAAPAAATPKPSIIDLGGMGSGIADSLYDHLWDRVQAGKTNETSGSPPSAGLQVAKAVRDRGGLQTRDDLKALLNEVDRIKSTGAQRQADLKAVVDKYAPAEKPATAEDLTDLTTNAQPGTRASPIAVKSPDDLAAAASAVNTAPTEGQKDAGNYAKGHISLQGLDISVENPKGSERSGTSSDGTNWSVNLPATYGYIKRTTGADGDHVDVYVGDRPTSARVFVVDQVNPDTRSFDEHKVMLGFGSAKEAMAAYQAAFSDGRGADRIGAVTQMQMPQFREWLAKGDQTKPLGRLPTKPTAKPAPKSDTATATQVTLYRGVRKADEATDAGQFFTDSRKIAETYSKHGDGGAIITRNATFKNVLEAKDLGEVYAKLRVKRPARAVTVSPELIQAAKDAGYDAIAHGDNAVGGGREYIVLDRSALAKAPAHAVAATTGEEPAWWSSLTASAKRAAIKKAGVGIGPALPWERIHAEERARLERAVKSEEPKPKAAARKPVSAAAPGRARVEQEMRLRAEAQRLANEKFGQPPIDTNPQVRAKDAITRRAFEDQYVKSQKLKEAALSRQKKGPPQSGPSDSGTRLGNTADRGGPVPARAWRDPALLSRAVSRFKFQQLGDKVDEVRDGLDGAVTAEEEDAAQITPEDRAGLKPDEVFDADEALKEAGGQAAVDSDTLREHIAALQNAAERLLGKEPTLLAATPEPPALNSGEAAAVEKAVSSRDLVDIAGEIDDVGSDLQDQDSSDEELAASVTALRQKLTQLVDESAKAIAEIDRTLQAASKRSGAPTAETENQGPPKGGPSALGDTAARGSVTDTAAFRKWFGESKVVDEGGKPLAVYHGTAASFDTFDKEKLGSATMHPTSGLGFFFSASPKVADLFTNKVDDSVWPPKLVPSAGANTMPVYLSIQKPFEMPVEKFRAIQSQPFGPDFESEQPDAALRMREYIAHNKDRLVELGYDGIHIPGDPKYADHVSGEEYSADAWVAFEPEQIKSATGNSGAFDASNPSVVADTAGRAPRVRLDSRRRAALERGLREIVVHVVGRDVEVSLEPTISAHNVGDAAYNEGMERYAAAGGRLSETAGGVAQMYPTGEALIRIATEDPNFNPHETAWHESYHVAEATLMTDAEYAAVETPESIDAARKMAAKVLGLDQNGPEIGELPGYEARAIAFEGFVKGENASGLGAALRRFFVKLRRIVRDVRALLTRKGYHTLSDIYSDVYRGKMADRTPGYRDITGLRQHETRAGSTISREAPAFENASTEERRGAARELEGKVLHLPDRSKEASAESLTPRAKQRMTAGQVSAGTKVLDSLGTSGFEKALADHVANPAVHINDAVAIGRGLTGRRLDTKTDAVRAIRARHQAILDGRANTPARAAAAPAAEAKPSAPAAATVEKPAASQEQNAPPAEPAKAASETTPERGTSKIGKSIEAKAIEAQLTNGFEGRAGYDKITIKDQAKRAADLINTDLAKARAVIRGERPLPDGLRGTALITAMEEHIKGNPSADLAYELANSPLVSATSAAAQELRLAAERNPDSAAAKLQQIRDAQVKKAGGANQVKAKKAAMVKGLKAETSKVNLSKEDLSWAKFLKTIQC